AFERFHRKTVRSLKDDEGWVHEAEGEIQTLIISYFIDIFQSSRPDIHAIDECLATLVPRVSDDMNAMLTRPFSPEEVKQALNQMHPLKSSGPDGMSPIFFQKFWHIVGSDTASCVLCFLNEGVLDPALNHTHIVLLPKCACLERVTDFRPISFCNVVHKIASKAIANRLKPLLGSIISESQFAFVPGRLTTDNVLVAHELNFYLTHNYWGSSGHISLKLDINKAYDHVGWIFLERVLVRLGSHATFVKLIMHCVSSAFFILVEWRHLVVYFSRRSGLEISKAVLQTLEEASGFKMNIGKSVVVFSKNTLAHVPSELAMILGVPMVPKHDKYLELPSIVEQSKRTVFDSIKDRIWRKMQCWSTKKLSQAGRMVMIKSVL
ncbi:UNVERIFIED_CONTAM: hypothetical protein Slati_3683800, partial [Sesamum latifolium]